MKSYRDVNVVLSPRPDGAIGVRVDWTGQVGNSEFRLPFTPAELTRSLLGGTARAGGAADDGSHDPAGNARGGFVAAGGARLGRPPAELGAALFDALFQGDSRDVLGKAVSAAEAEDDGGVRIRLAINLMDPDLSHVASIPWELLWRRGQQSPLVLSTQTALVRSLDIPMSIRQRRFVAPLKILVTISNPIGTAPLNLSGEYEQLARAWGHAATAVTIETVAPTKAALLDALATGGFHVIHYMGHGDFSAETGGVLLLENDDRTAHAVSGSEFAMWVADAKLQLIFLNACNTATNSDEPSANPFAGVATALIKSGVPAVVAMQFPISDPAAVAFSKTFYDRVARGFPVDAAVAEARKLLYSPDTTEWVTPVLYMRAADGDLFAAEVEANSPTLVPAAPTMPDVIAPAAGIAALPFAVPPAPAPPADAWETAPADTLRIFLPACDQDLDQAQERLATLLRDQADAVVVTSPPFDDRHLTVVASLAARADLTVQLLGASPGRRVNADGPRDPLMTYPLEALRIGLEAARAQLVVITANDRDSIESPRYAARLDELAAMERSGGKFELKIVTESKLVDTAVLDAIKALRDRRRADGLIASGEKMRTVFVDAHPNDADRANTLADYLEAKLLTANMSTSDRSIPDFRMLDTAVRESALYFLVDGAVDPEWLRNRRAALRKAATEARTPLLYARYVAPVAAPDEQPVIDASRFKDFNTLNNSEKRWFDDLFEAQA